MSKPRKQQFWSLFYERTLQRMSTTLIMALVGWIVVVPALVVTGLLAAAKILGARAPARRSGLVDIDSLAHELAHDDWASLPWSSLSATATATATATTRPEPRAERTYDATLVDY